MITPLFLCLYLLFLVIDVVLMWVWLWSDFLIWLGWFHLLLFLLIIALFREEFYALSEKYQTRIVFSPRVYWFFSLASWLLLSALFFSGSFVSFVARGVLLALLLFWFGVQLFDFFPVKTRLVQRIVVRSTLLGVAACSIVAWDALRLLVGWWNWWVNNTVPTQQDQASGSNQQVLPELKSGVSLEDIEEMMNTWAEIEVNTWENSTGTVIEEMMNTGTDLTNNEPITYRFLLPYFDELWLLPAVRETPTFANVARQEDIYQAFQRARWLKMIGTNINPNRQVRCENLMVLIGLAKKRSVDSSLPVLEAYWQEAKQQDRVGSCLTKKQVATQDMLNNLK